MDKRKRRRAFFPTKRRLIQVYAALLYNAHLRGFVDGEIFTGITKGICVPGLNCYSCPGAIAACPLGAIQNELASTGHRAPFYALGILMLFGLILGRTVCGWLCPFGLIQELLHKIPTPKIPKGRATRALSALKYVLLIVFVIALPLWSAFCGAPMPAFCKYVCPAGTLEGAVALLANRANEAMRSMLGALFTWKLALMLALVVLCVFLYRAFCRFLCPLGAIYGLFSKISLLGLRVSEDRCTACGRCAAVCEMDVRRVGDRECIHCGKCVSVCAEGAITWGNGGVSIRGNGIPERKKSKRRNGASVRGNKIPDQTKSKRRMGRILFGILTALLLAALVYANIPRGVRVESEPAAQNGREIGSDVGMRCPDFSVPLYREDGNITLADCLGKPTLLNFWATWCGSCIDELPDFQRICDQYGDRINMLAVHSAAVTDDVEAYLDATDFSFRFALDADGAMIPALGGSAMLPQTVVLDADGVIVCNAIGSLKMEELEMLLDGVIR